MKNSLAEKHPELVAEWSERNLPLTPMQISYGSKKLVWWKGSCGHEWQTSVKARSAGERCPICAGVRIVPGINDLATRYPEIAAEWSERNRPLDAKQCGTKVSINDEKTIGILLDVLLPEVNLAFTFPSRETDRGAKVIEVMQYMCAARKIQLIEVRKKEPIELAHEIKQAFAKAHLYIDSDSEKEIDYLRKWYFHQTV